MKLPPFLIASLAFTVSCLPLHSAAPGSAPSANAAAAAAAPLPCRLIALPDRVRVEIGGQLFTAYVHQGTPRPYCYPVLACDGTPLTRDFPMLQPDGEEHDHPHHRSLWFTHGEVNRIDFWKEGKSQGTIVLDGPCELQESPTHGLLRARHRWLAPDGRLVCTDSTQLRFAGTANQRTLDYEVTLLALPDTPLELGDTKEGSMAIRLAQWMTMPHKYQKKPVATQGQAVNAAGLRNAAAWGQRSPWVDYFAPRGDTIYGVALFDHPRNPRHPTWWHVRDYGLLAANPFGQHDFENKKDQPHLGTLTVPAGGRVTFRWRFVFHTGDAASARLADHYQTWASDQP